MTLKVNYKTVIQEDRLKSYWKLNSAILLEDSFHVQFKKFWELIHENISQFQDIAEWLDKSAKSEIKNFCHPPC